MSCQYYQPRKCWKHADLADANIACLGDCSKCSFGNFDAVPTVGALGEIYTHYAVASGRVRPRTALGNVTTLMKVAGFCFGEDYLNHKAIFDEADVERYVQAVRGSVKEVSIRGALERCAAVFGRHALKYYATHGLHLAPFPMTDIKVTIEKWVSLSRAERMKIRQYQFDLFHLSDPRKYLAVTGAWERGARKSDVLRFHWSKNFVERDGVLWWCYTANKNGKHSEWPVDPDTVLMLREAERRVKALRVQGTGAAYQDSYLRVRDYDHNEMITSTIWNECGKDLRGIMGWDGAKAMHCLRKDATDQVYQNMGIDEACEFSTDTAEKVRKYYSGKKRIDPRTISIAKM